MGRSLESICRCVYGISMYIHVYIGAYSSMNGKEFQGAYSLMCIWDINKYTHAYTSISHIHVYEGAYWSMNGKEPRAYLSMCIWDIDVYTGVYRSLIVDVYMGCIRSCIRNTHTRIKRTATNTHIAFAVVSLATTTGTLLVFCRTFPSISLTLLN